MKTIASIPTLTAIATLLIASGALAAAPAPAPAPKAEETCTVEKMEKPDVECLECKAASLADPEACDRKMKGTEYMAECRAGGREAWTEVWCRKKERAEKAAAPPEVAPTEADTATPAAPEPDTEAPPPEPDTSEAAPPEPDDDAGGEKGEGGKKLNRQAAAAQAGREKSGCAGGGAVVPIAAALALLGLMVVHTTGRLRRRDDA
ncbi:MAG: hypothetical protein KC635_20310 [Myxococcales bacterium]|nr:hypothetical protein [Myxococcales bacterium]MCB9735955.1 hypothetical protein [Deltaproteobacteria bacterium]